MIAKVRCPRCEKAGTRQGDGSWFCLEHGEYWPAPGAEVAEEVRQAHGQRQIENTRSAY